MAIFLSFFSSEFQDRIKAVEIYELFRCNWEVVKLVIMLKRNKNGKIFSFSRFKEVEKERLLAVKLDNILMMEGRYM